MKLVWLIRIGVAGLALAGIAFVFWPATLVSLATPLPPSEALTRMIQGFRGFDEDWRVVVALMTVSAYIYAYLAIVLIAGNVSRSVPSGVFEGLEGRRKWNVLSLVLVGRGRNAGASGPGTLASTVREYSRSREGLGALAFDAIGLIAVSYIGYSALQRPPAGGGLLERIFDALLVTLWCHCLFSIVMWLLFVVLFSMKSSARKP
jgi:hypothetical protein